ncbi:TonB-linked SusC/RagA family outer membrane protein [Catalinimonas alkaloidigena]|uniref:SusC/RagA family TonB-linked outer membrane protein n=1 Tax=Catalinimonas alkaloidigena TaxID=1075417 RepID=UPI002405A18D|nr:TonB-dependent receptor [Catalinimonas alkaloidigena]MDF9795430.1 TonB-linked SusC/RagA family outer membrane protein [Catalinimonas alkaloidigena]
MKAFKLCAILLLVSMQLLAQERNVTGTVTSLNDSGPLPGVNILVKGTTQGTVTDVEGNYSITVPGSDAVLVFSSVGYETQEVNVGNHSTIDLELSPDLQSLQEVVVVGYGEQQRENLTGSVETLEGQEISRQPVMQTSQALQGKMPGVTVTSNSSQPGADGATIRIRGIGTLGNSNPLVLIDGVPGDMNGVDPRDIASMSVLKDAAAASIYGSRAANGVILITTKRGASGEFKVNYSGYGGWQQPTNFPEYLGGYEYMTYHNLARENLGQDPLYSQESINEWQQNYQSNPDLYPNTDWIDEVFTENGFQQHHHLSLSGGNEFAKVLGSVSFMDQNGNVPNYNFKRYQARLNTDLTVSEKLSVNFDLNIRRSIRNQPSGSLDDVIRQAYRIPPIAAAVYSDGSWGPGWNGKNPVAIANEGGFDEDQYNYFRGILRAVYQPLEGMEVSFMYAPEYTDDVGKEFTRNYEVYNFETADLEYVFPGRNSLSQYNQRALTNNMNAVATYEKQLGDHFFKGLLGYELITYHWDRFTAYRDNFPLQDYPQLNVGSQENMQNSGTAEEWGLQSYFARLNYDFQGKYLLEANVRRDGSSRFAKGNQYGIFPAFSAGWRISEEAFMSNVGLISNLKLRASWGQLGNQNLVDNNNNPIIYPFASVIALGNDFLFGGTPQSGAAQTDLANKDISWETTETTNFGLDVGMFANRFTLSAEYYIRNTKDILLQLPIPVTIGLNAPFQNAGQVKNAGWDLGLGWRNNAGEFSYSINANVSNVINEVTDLVGTGPYISGSSIIREGDPINSIYGYQSISYFQTQEEIDNAPQQFGALAPGDIRYVNMLTEDTNGDGVPDEVDDAINSEDRVIIGNPFPRLTYGLNISLDYKGFDLSVFAQGVGKKDLYLSGDAVWAFQNAGKIQDWHLDYWTPENPDAAHPRLVATTSHNNYETSDFWVWNASYLRLRNLTLGYTFSDQVIQNDFLDNLRVYFSGQNLFTIDNMPQGIDPEAPNGTAGAAYPITSVYTFGLNLNF